MANEPGERRRTGNREWETGAGCVWLGASNSPTPLVAAAPSSVNLGRKDGICVKRIEKFNLVFFVSLAPWRDKNLLLDLLRIRIYFVYWGVLPGHLCARRDAWE